MEYRNQTYSISFCDLTNEQLGLDKGANFQILKAENTCLRTLVGNLQDGIKKQSNEVSALADQYIILDKKISMFEAKNQAFLTTQVSAFQTHKIIHNKNKELHEKELTNLTETHKEYVAQQSLVFERTAGLYEGWTWSIGILLALSAVISFFFLTLYKKREIAEVVDSAVEKAGEKLGDSAVAAQAVVNAFDSEQVKSVLVETIQSEELSEYIGSLNQSQIDNRNIEQDLYIRSIVYDMLNENGINASAQYDDVFSDDNEDEG